MPQHKPRRRKLMKKNVCINEKNTKRYTLIIIIIIILKLFIDILHVTLRQTANSQQRNIYMGKIPIHSQKIKPMRVYAYNALFRSHGK